MSRENRVLHILDSLAAGKPSTQILDQLKFDDQKAVVTDKRGEESEKAVLDALRNLRGIVTKATLVSADPRFNNQGVDILAKTAIPFVGQVEVQSKSSLIGIQKEINRIRLSQQIEDEDAWEKWLAKQRRVFLNGAIKAQKIKRSFKEQLLKIYRLRIVTLDQRPSQEIIDLLK